MVVCQGMLGGVPATDQSVCFNCSMVRTLCPDVVMFRVWWHGSSCMVRCFAAWWYGGLVQCAGCIVRGAWWYGGMVDHHWWYGAWCAANDYLPIAQFEVVIGLHPTILLVT